MIWDTWADFFAMGGYALYVWGSIIVTATCMLGEIAMLTMRRKSALEQIRMARRPVTRRNKGAGNENTA